MHTHNMSSELGPVGFGLNLFVFVHFVLTSASLFVIWLVVLCHFVYYLDIL